MSASVDQDLARIHDLARQAAAQVGMPDEVKPLLAEIVELSGRRDGDTPEPSDVPQTENQSL